MSVDRQPGLCSVTPAAQTTTDTYATVTGSTIDTVLYGQRCVAFQVSETGGANGITAQVQGSIDGTNWNNLKTLDETGTLRGAADISIAADATATAVLTESENNGGRSSHRYFRVQVKATVGGSQGSATVVGFSK